MKFRDNIGVTPIEDKIRIFEDGFATYTRPEQAAIRKRRDPRKLGQSQQK